MPFPGRYAQGATPIEATATPPNEPTHSIHTGAAGYGFVSRYANPSVSGSVSALPSPEVSRGSENARAATGTRPSKSSLGSSDHERDGRVPAGTATSARAKGRSGAPGALSRPQPSSVTATRPEACGSKRGVAASYLKVMTEASALTSFKGFAAKAVGPLAKRPMIVAARRTRLTWHSPLLARLAHRQLRGRGRLPSRPFVCPPRPKRPYGLLIPSPGTTPDTTACAGPSAVMMSSADIVRTSGFEYSFFSLGLMLLCSSSSAQWRPWCDTGFVPGPSARAMNRPTALRSSWIVFVCFLTTCQYTGLGDARGPVSFRIRAAGTSKKC